MNETRIMVQKNIEKILSNTNAYVNIEKSIYNWTIKNANELNIDANWTNDIFTHMYIQRYMDIVFHIKEYNMEEKLKNKEILSKDIGFLEHKDYNVSRWKPVIYETDETDKEGIFQCKKCHSKKTTYYSLQTRSADEPMTNFITCLNCNNRWKM